MPKELPPGWVKQESRTYPGKFYYFHKATRRTTWIVPTDEEPFQIRKTKNKEPKSTNVTCKSPIKTSKKPLNVKEKRGPMVPRAVRQASTSNSSSSNPKKILNVSVLNRNNCCLVADYSSDDEEESSKAEWKKEKDENEIKKKSAILPAATERSKVQLKWKPVGPKIQQPSSKLVPKEEPTSNVKKKDAVSSSSLKKDAVSSSSLKKDAISSSSPKKDAVSSSSPKKDAVSSSSLKKDALPASSLKKDAKTIKKKIKSKKSPREPKVTSPSISCESLVSENSCLKVPQSKKTAKTVSKKNKTTKNLAKNLEEEPVINEKLSKSKSSSKKPKIKRAGKKKSTTALNTSDLSKVFDSNKQIHFDPNVPLVPLEQLPPFQQAVEIQNSYPVPIYGENDASFSNISSSSSFHLNDSYLLGLEDSSQPMEVDPDCDMVELIVKLRKDMSNEGFNTATGDLTKNFEMDTSNSIDHTTQPQVAYVVFDTNTLLNSGDLTVMKHICDGKYSTADNLPYIIIPWVVMQELDVLKSRTKQQKLAARAQRAILFLSSYFTKKHPRVIGQTLKEAMQMREHLPAENNDDKILQCCMQLESKYPDSKIVLYSNDVNLCNKTLINGIAAFNNESIFSGLSNLSGITADDCDQNRRKSYSPEHDNKETSSCREINEHNNKSQPKKVAPRLTMANQISGKLKVILKGVLGLVLETEMKEAYNEVWLKIIKVQPPWELKDIFYCILEHWFALFGQIYTQRKLMETKYRRLSDYFSSKKGFPDKLDVVSSNLVDSIFVLEPLLTKDPLYKDQVKCCLESIEILKQICLSVTAGEVDVNSSLDQLLEQQLHAEKQTSTKNCLDPHMVSESSFNTEFAMSIALTKFQKVWEMFNTYCQEVERTLQNGASPETCQQVFATLQTSIPMMEITYNQFSSCLGFSAADISNEVNMFTVLSEQLNAILPHLGCQDNDPLVNCIHLQTLFSNPEKREMLTNGLAQLEVMIRGLHTYQGHLVGT